MATYSSILAWRIPWTEKPAVCGVAKRWIQPGTHARAYGLPPAGHSAFCTWKLRNICLIHSIKIHIF